MASVRQISRRIRSVQNTAKITKAMSMIAASKLRRSQDAATQGRSYSDHMEKMVSSVMGQIGEEINNQPLASNREINNVGLLIITPDRGLTGGLNSNLIRAAGDFIAKQNVPVKVVTVGKKGTDYSKRSSLELISDFSGIGDRPSPSDTVGIARELMKSFESGIVDAFYIAYAQFISTTLQKPSVTKLLPISETAESDSNSEYIYEPTLNLVNHTRKLGVPVICFPRGIDNYKDFCEIVKPDMVNIDYSVDPEKAVKEIKIPIQGGLDPKVLLTDKENLHTKVIKYLQIFKDHPYVFNLGHGILPETKIEMVEELVKIVRDFK